MFQACSSMLGKKTSSLFPELRVRSMRRLYRSRAEHRPFILDCDVGSKRSLVGERTRLLRLLLCSMSISFARRGKAQSTVHPANPHMPTREIKMSKTSLRAKKTIDSRAHARGWLGGPRVTVRSVDLIARQVPGVAQITDIDEKMSEN